MSDTEQDMSSAAAVPAQSVDHDRVEIEIVEEELLVPVGETVLSVDPNPAQIAAEVLGYEFLAKGNFAASSGPVIFDTGQFVLSSASAGFTSDFRAAARQEGFAGLQIQSVGFEQGVDSPQVHIYVRQGSQRQLQALPKEIHGVGIRLHKIGSVSVRPDAAASATNRGYLFERHGRICCGSSCAPTSEISTGTLGALVRKLGSTGTLYLLSNNHVFSGCNHVPHNQPILAPSSSDGRPDIRAPTEVGRHMELVELRSGNPTFVNPCVTDVALAAVTDPRVISSWQGDGNDGYDTPSQAGTPVSKMAVKKFGRTTGFTRGVIESRITVPTPIEYRAKHMRGTLYFSDFWLVRSTGNGPFALPGDSGSLVVNEDASRAIGLVFAANNTGDYGLIVPMERVIGEFGGIAPVSGHGV